MDKTYLFGIDVWLPKAPRRRLFDRQGRTLATAFRKSRLHQPAPGVVEEDPERQFKSVCQCIRACVARAGIDPAHVAGVGIDGQMAGILGVGEDGRHVTPYDSWLDTRCAPYIAMMKNEAGGEVIRKTGGPPSFNHGPKILWWKHERPETFAQIAAFVQPGGYAAMRLCGLDASQAFVDKSYLHFSGFADNQRGQWDAGLCAAFGVPVSKLPRIVDCQTVVGQVTADAARSCGLRAGTPVVAGWGTRRRRSWPAARRAKASAWTWPAPPPCSPRRPGSSTPTRLTVCWAGASRPLRGCGIRMPTSTAAA